MSETKVDSVQALNTALDALKEKNCVFMYCLARYDCGENKKTPHFHTRISLSSKLNIDDTVAQAIFRPVGVFHEEFNAIKPHLEAVVKDGWCAAFYAKSPDGHIADWSEMIRPISKGEEGQPTEVHVSLDMLRELMVEWNNATHEGKLKWEGSGAGC